MAVMQLLTNKYIFSFVLHLVLLNKVKTYTVIGFDDHHLNLVLSVRDANTFSQSRWFMGRDSL